VNLWITSTL